MALQAPEIYLPDGSETKTYIVYSSNVREHFFEGTVDPNAIDVQVQIRGSGFVSDPTLVHLDLPNFKIPNPESYPDGMSLVPGVNQIDIRAIDVSGNISSVSTIMVSYITDKEISLQVSAPTGIEVLRHSDKVTIVASKNTEPEVLGYNFYVSKESGGTVSGYFKINKDIVAQSYIETNDIATHNEDISFSHSGKYLRIKVQEEEEDGTLVRELSNSRVDLSDAVIDQVLSMGMVGKDVVEHFYFDHNRLFDEEDGTINNDQFLGIPDDQPLYYVITAVGYDNRYREYVESKYSMELVGLPLIIDATIKDMVPRTRQDIVLAQIQQIQKADPSISLIPGSTTRDVHLDPQSTELERLSFITDFIHRSQSFLTLLAIDDSDQDGISDPINVSPYKQALKAALFLNRDEDVQLLIDDAFDKKAGDYTLTRKGAIKSIGQAVFYTTKKPTQDKVIELGAMIATTPDESLRIPAFSYEVTSQITMLLVDVDSYYNPSRKRWEIIANIRALDSGTDGNRPSNQINTIVSGVSGLSVINLEPTRWGSNIESNRSLAERGILALVSVDSGTTGGYLATARKVSGVQEVLVVEAGHDLMMRDWDDVRTKHIGGKVDIWIKGLNEKEVTDTFAFSFDIVENIGFTIIDVDNLVFQSTDSNLSVDNPISEMLSDETKGWGFRNVTKGLDFDLAIGSGDEVIIQDYRTIKLSINIAQPAFDIDDIFVGDYRFQSTNTFVPTQQPVRRIVSIVGTVSGTLDMSNGYSLYKTEDPLLYGESVGAQDYVKIMQYNGIPSGAVLTVNDEEHILVGTRLEDLDSIGIDNVSIRVFNQARTIEYNGPDATQPDYLITEGSSTTPASIVRVSSGNIANGQVVSVDYDYDENFTVRYVVNDLIRVVQDEVSDKKHTSADVLVKHVVENAMDLENTVILKPGVDRAQIDSLIRTKVSQETNNRPIGGGIRQADIVHVQDSIAGVDYPIVPFSKMAWADGSQILRNTLLNNYVELSSLHSGTNKAYILAQALMASTTDNGGEITKHRGVFQDDQSMVFASSLSVLTSQSDQTYIIGLDGAVISGYSDDTTLTNEGFVTSISRDVERKNRTANRVVLSLNTIPEDDLPSDHLYSCSFIVSGNEGTGDLISNPLESITVGEFNIIYSEGN